MQLRGPLRDVICLEPVPNLHDAGREPWAAPSSGKWRFARVWIELPPDLEHHLSQRRDGSFWMRSLSIKSVGLNLDLGDLNAEFFERRNR